MGLVVGHCDFTENQVVSFWLWPRLTTLGFSINSSWNNFHYMNFGCLEFILLVSETVKWKAQLIYRCSFLSHKKSLRLYSLVHLIYIIQSFFGAKTAETQDGNKIVIRTYPHSGNLFLQFLKFYKNPQKSTDWPTGRQI